MSVYLGNKSITDLYFNEKKIKEAYFGLKKVYPVIQSNYEDQIGILHDYSLAITGTILTANGISLNEGDQVTINQMQYDSYLNKDGYYPIIYIASTTEDLYVYNGFPVLYIVNLSLNEDIPNPSFQIYNTPENLNFLNTEITNETGHKIGYTMYANQNISTQYTNKCIGRVGCMFYSKEYKFEFSFIKKALIFQIIFTDSDGNTYDQLAIRNIQTGEITQPQLRINGSSEPYYGNYLVNDRLVEDLDTILQGLNDIQDLCFVYILWTLNSSEKINCVAGLRGSYYNLIDFFSNSTNVETEASGIDCPYENALSQDYELIGRKNGKGDRIVVADYNSDLNFNKITIQNSLVRIYMSMKKNQVTYDSYIFKVYKETSTGLHGQFRLHGASHNEEATLYIDNNSVNLSNGDSVEYNRTSIEKYNYVTAYIQGGMSNTRTASQKINISTSDILQAPNGNISFEVIEKGMQSTDAYVLQYYDGSWKSFGYSSPVDRVVKQNNEIQIIYS